MQKRKVCFILTIVGIFIIIVIQTIVNIMENEELKKENYIKENLVLWAKECIKEEKCLENDVTIDNLKDNGYINKEFLKNIEEYRTDSYVAYPSYEVVFIKKD